MRISVIGPGAVGGTLAAALAAAGHRLEMIARPAALPALRREGLVVDGARVDVRLSESVSDGAELVILSVRAFDLPAAARALARSLGSRAVPPPVLVVVNGLDGVERVAAVLGRRDGILGGLALFPATRRRDGRIVRTGPGGLHLGPLDARDRPLAATIARALTSERLPVSAIDRLRGAQWTKLLLNEVNALPAVTGLSVQAVCRHPRTAPILAACLTETVAVAAASRISFVPIGSLGAQHVGLIRSGSADEVVSGRLATLFGPYPNPASTLQSIRLGRRTEADALIGAVVRAAVPVRVPVPVHRLLLGLVDEVVTRGRFLTASETSRRVRRAVA